jgi:16S rRNA (cytosine967-C5)-methyltransferase
VTEQDIDRLAELQGRMLQQSALLVRVGGRVVYSTCTVGRRENDDVVTRFLSIAGGSFQTVDIASIVGGPLSANVTEQGWFRSVPEPGGPDGHFVAVLEKKR